MIRANAKAPYSISGPQVRAGGPLMDGLDIAGQRRRLDAPLPENNPDTTPSALTAPQPGLVVNQGAGAQASAGASY